MTKKAVITSDIVQSSQLSVGLRVELMKKIEEKLKELSTSSLVMESEVYRGDSFQCLLPTPKLALKATLILKTYIKGLDPSGTKWSLDEKGKENEVVFTRRMFDARMSLAVGEVETETGKLGTSNGEAFRLSGRKLDEMKKLKQSFSMASSDQYEQELATEAALINFIVAKATALQCQVIQLKLEGLTEMEIAGKLRIQQSAVNQRATSGGWHALETAVKRFETMYANG